MTFYNIPIEKLFYCISEQKYKNTRNHTNPKLLNNSVEWFTKKVESQTGW